MTKPPSRPAARAALALALALGACGPHATEIASSPDAATADDAGVDGADAGPRCVPGGTTAVLPTIISCDTAFPTRFALDAENLYWTDKHRGAIVFKAPLAGGGATVLVYDDGPAVGLAVDATYVYYTQPERGHVMRVPIAGGQARVIAAGLTSPNFLALGNAPDGPSLYWTGGQTMGTGTITKLTLVDGAKPETLIDGQARPGGLAAANGFIYWTDLADGTILRAPDHLAVTVGTTIRTATRLAAGLRLPSDITLAGGYAYAPDGTGTGRIVRVPMEGGALEPVADVTGFPFGIATDGVAVYWTTTGKGGVFKAPLGASVQATTIVDGEVDARFLAVSPDDVYWGVWGNGGSVRRMAKLGRPPGN